MAKIYVQELFSKVEFENKLFYGLRGTRLEHNEERIVKFLNANFFALSMR